MRKSGRENEDRNAKRAKIRALNDAFRKTFWGGRVMMTAGVAALENPVRNAVVEKIKAFDAFDENNDPWGEHDFVSVEHDGQTYFAKIDLYESRACQALFHCRAPFCFLPRVAKRRFRIVRPWPCAPAHRLVSGESASTLFPQSVFTYAESPKAQVADQTITRLRTAIDLPGRQPPYRWRGKPVDPVSDLERGSFRNDAVFDEAPQRDRKFPGQRDNADLAAAHPLAAEALVPPQR